MDIRIRFDGAATVRLVRNDVPVVVRASVKRLGTEASRAVPHVVVDIITTVAPAAVWIRCYEYRARARRSAARSTSASGSAAAPGSAHAGCPTSSSRPTAPALSSGAACATGPSATLGTVTAGASEKQQWYG